MPRDHAWDPRSEGEYEAEGHTCQACAARDLKTKDAERKPGQHTTVRRIPGQGPALPG